MTVLAIGPTTLAPAGYPHVMDVRSVDSAPRPPQQLSSRAIVSVSEVDQGPGKSTTVLMRTAPMPSMNRVEAPLEAALISY